MTLVACVVADRGAQGNAAREGAWRRQLAEQLPIYMMPARFVIVPALPVNGNGKRDRDAVLALAATPADAGAAPAPATASDTTAATGR